MFHLNDLKQVILLVGLLELSVPASPVWLLAELSLIFCRGFLIIGQTSRPQPALGSMFSGQHLTGSKERVRANTDKSYIGLDIGQGDMF